MTLSFIDVALIFILGLRRKPVDEMARKAKGARPIRISNDQASHEGTGREVTPETSAWKRCRAVWLHGPGLAFPRQKRTKGLL
jgi:hypothetical protein